MKVIIIGAGAAGVTAAINYKRNHRNDDVLIIEHLDKPLKKILATGNGKCNLGNSELDFSCFNNPDFVKKIVLGYDYLNFFDSISIKTKLIDTLAYPLSESAVSVREALLKETSKLGIKISVNDEFIDYKTGNNITVLTSKGIYSCDKLFVSGGLKSSPKLGSDGSVIEILGRHGYKIIQPIPGLSPLYTKEKTKLIDGIRIKTTVSLFRDSNLINEEKGEVLFKDHGLSGIVIFNTMSLIARNPNDNFKILIDLVPDYSKEEIYDYLNSHSFDELMLAFINPKIKAYLWDRYKNKEEIIKHLKKLDFTYDKSYGFDFSQVSVGGISISEVDDNLMSKKERNVYFIGEILDVDGPCGGYNLTWAFASALYASKNN